MIDYDKMVEGMCMTYRHDFGLDKPEPTGNWYDKIACGMTDEEREALRTTMRQLIEHNVKPVIEPLQAKIQQRLATPTEAFKDKLIESLSAGMTKLSADLQEALSREAKDYNELVDELSKVQADRDHWKANHDQMVARKALLEQRPDLPVDRIPAYKEMERLQSELAAVRQELEEAKRDAERYRWTRDKGCNFVWAEIGAGNCLKGLDEAIDAARQQSS
jgi:DNA repair exonuclease SbcCD ATPase subunit